MSVPPDILLPQVLAIENPSEFKLHLARHNQQVHPLDIFVRDREEWICWNRWRSGRDDFSRPCIFSLIDFYPQRDCWLFGGAFRVLVRSSKAQDYSYRIEPIASFEPFIGRLKLRMKSPGRSRAFYLENLYATMVVDEVLPEPYSGQPFRGFDQIHLTFAELENLILTQRADWKTALHHAKGIYLITDSSSGKCYVGSAYGDTGIWSRWESYIHTGHGNNLGLAKLIEEEGIGHARKHFSFALIEHMLPNLSDDLVLQREAHWKRVLLTRGDFGFNRN